MFDFIKKKITNFTAKLTNKVKEKAAKEAKVVEAKPEVVAPKPKAAKKEEKPAEEKPKPAEKIEVKPQVVKKEEVKPEVKPEAKLVAPRPELAKKEARPVAPRPEALEKAPKVRAITRLKQVFVPEVSLSEKEIDDFLWEFELALLEGDVAHDVAKQICSEIKTRLLQKKFRRGEDVASIIKESVRSAITDALSAVKPFDLVEAAKQTKPFVIMFLGPNGAGKSTTLAKIAVLFRQKGLSSIFAASDTFRAASIEQLEHHAQALGIRMVKHQYGSDPAAVAYDAIQAAKAHNIDCVLIDTAGRQETNRNLMDELKKIARVCKPNVKLYVDEALAGNALVERVESFKEHVGVDGLILSKMDLDVKGGGAISIARATNIPILFFGTGQDYSALKPFRAEEIIQRILP